MILKDSIRRVQSENEQDQWYMSITDAALYIAIGGFINEANRLLEGLWKHKIPHDRTTWLPDIAFEMLWYAAGNRPASAPFPKPDIDELELSYRDYMVMPLWASQYANTFDTLDPFSKGKVLMATKDGKFPTKKKEQEALNQFKLYFESTAGRPAYSICQSLSMATELASRIGEEDFAIDLLKKWAGKFKKYPYDSAVVLIGSNRHVAPLLLKGIIAKELDLTKKICDTFVDEAIAAIDNRMKDGSILVYGKLSWSELLKKLSKLAIKSDPEMFSKEEKKSKWIGRQPASTEAIKETEKRIGLKLPGDYKNFLKTSNGFSGSGYSPELSSIEEVCSLKIAYKDHEDIFEIIKEYPGEEYAQNNNDTIAEYVERAIAISRASESEVWLIPPARKNGEWQCWYFHTGEHRFRNFRYFIEHLVQMFEEY